MREGIIILVWTQYSLFCGAPAPHPPILYPFSGIIKSTSATYREGGISFCPRIRRRIAWRNGVQADNFARFPCMLLSVKDQYSRQQFNFVPKELKRKRARLKCGVHEDTFAKRYVVRNGLGLVEKESDR